MVNDKKPARKLLATDNLELIVQCPAEKRHIDESADLWVVDTCTLHTSNAAICIFALLIRTEVKSALTTDET